MNENSRLWNSTMRKGENPCYGCTKETGRYPGCHDHCPKRAEWLKRKAAIDKNYKESVALRDFRYKHPPL